MLLILHRLYHLTNNSKLSYQNAQKSYPVSLKLDAIDYAKTTSNHVAARMFGVDHTQTE